MGINGLFRPKIQAYLTIGEIFSILSNSYDKKANSRVGCTESSSS